VVDVGQWWCAVVAATVDAPAQLLRVQSTRHPDEARVAMTQTQALRDGGDDVTCIVTYDDDGRVVKIEPTRNVVPNAPPLWFVELRESNAQPPAVTIVAFTGHGGPPGRLYDQPDADDLPIVSTDQVGAVRWYPATGEIDQIYVAPELRRRQIGTALLVSAGTLSVARGWPRLWSDGQRTVLGEHFRNSQAWRSRAADLTHIAPPMSPGDPAAFAPG
jgi:ribosomal protein S18 acetylase RimI-like enzyme